MSPKRIYLGKRKGCNPVHVDMASHIHTLGCVPRWRGIYRLEKEVRTIAFIITDSCSCWVPTCRILTIMQNVRTPMSPSSSYRPSWLLMFAYSSSSSLSQAHENSQKESVNKTEIIDLHNLASEVTSFHCCCILLTRNESLSWVQSAGGMNSHTRGE